MRKGTGISIGLALIISGAGFLGYRAIRRKKLYSQILSKIGVTTVSLDSYDDWFDHGYHNDPTGKSSNWKKIDNAQLIKWADEIDDALESYSATNWFANDDEEQIYAVFRAIPDGVALSQLSEKYATRHSSDLKEDINGLDQDEVNKVGEIMATYVAYRPTS